MANAKDNPFNRMQGGLPSDIGIVQALNRIAAELKRIGDQGEEKLKNERIAMASIKEPKYADRPNPHYPACGHWQGNPCSCSVGRGHKSWCDTVLGKGECDCQGDSGG